MLESEEKILIESSRRILERESVVFAKWVSYMYKIFILEREVTPHKHHLYTSAVKQLFSQLKLTSVNYLTDNTNLAIELANFFHKIDSP